MKIKAIITGSTGMVGEGMLYECLQSCNVEEILVINRKPCGYKNSKLKEIIHNDFFDLSLIENQLEGYNACFFCLGVSSVGMDKETYFKLTYTLTISIAKTLSKLNPDMTFCYISGAGTDSTEKGRSNWARVKGKTENDLMKLPFKNVFAFRPGYIHPTKGLHNTNPYYKYFTWMYPIGRLLAPNFFSTLKEIGLAMINSALNGYEKKILNGKEITELANKI